MTTAVDGDLDFTNDKYSPEIFSTTTTLYSDQIENLMGDNLGSRIQQLTSDAQRTTYLVDRCIRVKIPSDALRQDRVKHWEEKKREAHHWAWIQGGIAGLCALISKIGTRAMPELSLFTIGGAIGGSLLCYLNIRKGAEASYQVNGWNTSPLEKIANDRKTAYKEGFLHVYKNDLKLSSQQTSSRHNLLLPFEVQFLFERYFTQFCDRLMQRTPLSEQSKKEWLDDFTDHNPVTENLLRYAYEGQLPAKYAQVSKDYETLRKQLSDVRATFRSLRQQHRKKIQAVIDQINADRENALLAFNAMHAHWTRYAAMVRLEKIGKANNLEKQQEIENEYQDMLHRYQTYHSIATLPIRKTFDNQVSNAKAQLAFILDHIKTSEATSHAPFFSYAWGLLSYAQQIKEQPGFVYQPPVLNAMQTFNIPSPAVTPVININFIQQAKEQPVPDINHKEYLEFLSWQQETSAPPAPAALH